MRNYIRRSGQLIVQKKEDLITITGINGYYTVRKGTRVMFKGNKTDAKSYLTNIV